MFNLHIKDKNAAKNVIARTQHITTQVVNEDWKQDRVEVSKLHKFVSSYISL